MEQFDHLIEILVQIVLVEYKYGLGAWSDVRSKKGMVENAEFDNGRSPTWKLSYAHGGVRKDIAKAEQSRGGGHVPGLVHRRGPAHYPFSISARLKDTPVRRSLRSQSLCVETTRGFQV
jgi:hypothetical protein